MKYICQKCKFVTMVSVTSSNLEFCSNCGHKAFDVEGEMFST